MQGSWNASTALQLAQTPNPPYDEIYEAQPSLPNGKKFSSNVVRAMDDVLLVTDINPETGEKYRQQYSFYITCDTEPSLCLRTRTKTTIVDSHHCINKALIGNIRQITVDSENPVSFMEISKPYIPFQSLIPILMCNWNHPINCIRLECNSHERIHKMPREYGKEFRSKPINQLIEQNIYFWDHRFDSMMIACNVILLFEKYYYFNHDKFPSILHRRYLNDIFNVHKDILSNHRKIYFKARHLLMRNRLLEAKEG